jgi:4-amino-4-deoxy-L-arabinose transferase-like glycosyltransferase
LAGPLVFALICGAWVAAAAQWGPADYSVWGALKEHFIERGIHGMHHIQPWWYYAEVLPVQLLPWSFLVPGALVLAWRRRDRSDRFLLVTVIFVVLFFSISTEKRNLYVLPAFPAFALMTARFLGAMLGWDEAPAMSKKWVTAGQGILGALLVLVGLAAPFAAQRTAEVSPFVLSVMAVVLLATGVFTLLSALRSRILASALIPGIGFAVAFLVTASVVFPMFDVSKSSRSFAETIASETAASVAEGHRVLAFDLGNLPVHYAFYTNGLYTVETEDIDKLARHLAHEDREWAVVNADRLHELPLEIRKRITVVAATNASRRHVALITTRPVTE